ncbi:hypothetical protein SAMN04488581_0889 [Mycolicibacterium neoaurum]|uniref:hypothetical protein n=1 Tax=Mycolicibacterium neoaurum TaxID=1795 RepID=UPI00056428FF|nr:hypothetical protein [Mycolicibacterium neoaurum]SDC48160.1 hypothetical protein SAMN04488581_0889 [Mycolicibacterium neoaurum]
MTSDADWTIRPRVGLGRIEFGMSPAQVDALSATYGVISGRGADRVADDMLRETLVMFGDAMSEDEKQAFIAEYTGSGPSADSVTETRGDLVLRYEADRLCEIMPAHPRRPLFLDGSDLFALAGLDALRLLERCNQAPGRYADTAAEFDRIAITVDGFSAHDSTAGLLALDDSDERFRARTVLLRNAAYRPEQDMQRYTVHSLPPATDR